MIDYVRKILAIKKKIDQKVVVVDQTLSAWDHAVSAYHRKASLPGIIRVATGITESEADDQIDDAVLGMLGEFKQSVYNGSEIMKANAAMLNGLAAQMDSLFDLLDRAEKGSLKEVLEGTDGDRS